MRLGSWPAFVFGARGATGPTRLRGSKDEMCIKAVSSRPSPVEVEREIPHPMSPSSAVTWQSSSAAVPAAGSRGVPPRSPCSETLPELAGEDACATTSA